jgi:hypothetical protein
MTEISEQRRLALDQVRATFAASEASIRAEWAAKHPTPPPSSGHGGTRPPTAGRGNGSTRGGNAPRGGGRGGSNTRGGGNTRFASHERVKASAAKKELTASPTAATSAT